MRCLFKLPVFILLTCILSAKESFAQTSSNVFGNDFKVVVAMSGLDDQMKQSMSKKGVLFARLMSPGMIDPDKDQIVNPDVVEKFVKRFFPREDNAGIVVIDWEGQLMKDLKNAPRYSRKFSNAAKQYSEAIRVIKAVRPKVLVSIYGLPFREFWNRDSRWRRSCAKLASLLDECDFIAPSLYMLYTNQQVGKERNSDYLEENLRISLEMGKKLRKPVVPFVWQRWHTANKNRGLELMSDSEFDNYISVIKKFTYNGESIAGVIWWDNKKLIEDNKKGRSIMSKFGNNIKAFNEHNDEVLLDYLNKITDH